MKRQTKNCVKRKHIIDLVQVAYNSPKYQVLQNIIAKKISLAKPKYLSFINRQIEAPDDTSKPKKLKKNEKNILKKHIK